MEYNLTYLSLGGGVQSSTLLVCSVLGLYNVPKIDCAIFADTQAELPETYRHLDFLEEFIKPFGIPLHRVTVGSLNDSLLGKSPPIKNTYRLSIPAYTGNNPKNNKTGGMIRRQCTFFYKIEPIYQKVREILGLRKGKWAAHRYDVRALIGISLDESHRMKPSKYIWIHNSYPLVDSGIRRWDCFKILKENNVPIPVKSSCYFCPYHDNAYWKWLKEHKPDFFDKAASIDETIRNLTEKGDSSPVYLHKEGIPLREINFESPQLELFEHDGFGNECEGMCGV